MDKIEAIGAAIHQDLMRQEREKMNAAKSVNLEPIGTICGVRSTPPGTLEFWGYYNKGHSPSSEKEPIYSATQFRKLEAENTEFAAKLEIARMALDKVVAMPRSAESIRIATQVIHTIATENATKLIEARVLHDAITEWEKPYGLTDGTPFIDRLRRMAAEKEAVK